MRRLKKYFAQKLEEYCPCNLSIKMGNSKFLTLLHFHDKLFIIVNCAIKKHAGNKTDDRIVL